MNNSQIEKKLSDIKMNLVQRHLYGNDIIDIGSGRGYYSQWLSEINSDLHIVAVDHCALQDPQGFVFVQTDLEQPMPFADNSFDTLLAFDIIEHIAHEKQIIRELNRICRPQGILIGSAPHDDDGFLPAYNVTFHHRTDLTHKRYYTRSSLRTVLEQENFIVDYLTAQGIVPPAIFAEFFAPSMRPLIKKCIGALRRLHIINADRLSSDIFFVAHKNGERITSASCNHQ
ncbi:MAG: class I SAM-dependent methyltransferase [Candidatus Babeliales bacterium]|jgi:ubiquinone/menaquinone biosynthesis C-methylase UbiE